MFEAAFSEEESAWEEKTRSYGASEAGIGGGSDVFIANREAFSSTKPWPKSSKGKGRTARLPRRDTTPGRIPGTQASLPVTHAWEGALRDEGLYEGG